MDIFTSSIFALFLYFPEDKTEYIPAAITSAIFLIAAVITMRLIIKHSRKEALKTKDLEEAINKRNRENQESVK
jgi:hypothetical protein